MWEWAAIVAITCVVSFFVLASAEWMQRRLGEKVTLAIERLTGLILAMMATQMFLLGARILHFPLHAGGGLSSAQGRPGRRKRPRRPEESKKQGVSVDTPSTFMVNPLLTLCRGLLTPSFFHWRRGFQTESEQTLFISTRRCRRALRLPLGCVGFFVFIVPSAACATKKRRHPLRPATGSYF